MYHSGLYIASVFQADIFTVLKSCLNVLNKPRNGDIISVQTTYCLVTEELNKPGQSKQISLAWVPKHVDVDGNEVAIKLAHGLEPHISISHSACMAAIND